eukprot:s579_g29.t1
MRFEPDALLRFKHALLRPRYENGSRKTQCMTLQKLFHQSDMERLVEARGSVLVPGSQSELGLSAFSRFYETM